MTDTGAPRPRSSANFWIIVAVLVSVLAVEAVLYLRPKAEPARPAEALEAIASGPTEVETFGDSEAGIQIEFYAPLVLPWHVQTIGLLREYDQTHPGRIHVKLMPMGTAECDTEMHGQGYTCAVVLVNGESEFELPAKGTVLLEKRPNQPGSTYESEDVIAVIEVLVANERQ